MLSRIQLRRRAGGRRRVAAGLALLAAVGVIVAIVLITQSSTSPSSADASTQASGATTVQRRNLVATDTESGTLSYAHPQTVYNRLSGTITWLPAVGQVVSQGQALFRVDHMPVVLLNGNTPAYRDLDAADTAGPDILELNRDLIALGYTSEGIIANDEWQAATTSAVELFQESLGETATGTLTLGQVVFLPGNQVVSTVDATLGDAGGGGGGGGGGSSAADLRPSAPAPEFVSLTTRTNASQPPTSSSQGPTGLSQPGSHGKHPGHPSHSSSANTIAALIALLKAESAQLRAESAQLRAAGKGAGTPGQGGGSPSGTGGGSPSGSGGSPSGSGGSPSGSGSGGGTATAVLQTSSTRLVATVDLDASKQSEAKVGEKVTVVMPAGNTVGGTVSSVSPIAQSSSNSGNGNSGGGGGSGNGNGNGNGNGSSGATVPVNITLSGHQSGAGLDQAAVSVNFVQSEASNVLSVPVTALLATAGGGYAVQEAVAPHRLISVVTGLFAAGYVQISGPGVYPGLQVTDSQG